MIFFRYSPVLFHTKSWITPRSQTAELRLPSSTTENLTIVGRPLQESSYKATTGLPCSIGLATRKLLYSYPRIRLQIFGVIFVQIIVLRVYKWQIPIHRFAVDSLVAEPAYVVQCSPWSWISCQALVFGYHVGIQGAYRSMVAACLLDSGVVNRVSFPHTFHSLIPPICSVGDPKFQYSSVRTLKSLLKNMLSWSRRSSCTRIRHYMILTRDSLSILKNTKLHHARFSTKSKLLASTSQRGVRILGAGSRTT
jgi:hypothetical protein